MKRCLQWSARLYPAAWRARYGREFEALLDDLRPSWRDLWDILYGAFVMQLSTPAAYLKLGAMTAVLGAILATGWGFMLPRRYVSTAVMRIGPQTGPFALRRLASIQQEVLSRASLSEMIQRPDLNLYSEERKGHPLEDIVQGMRSRDIRIQGVQAVAARDGMVFRIEFASSDPAKAQAVARALAGKFTASPGLEVLDPANLPTKSVSPNPLRICIFGLIAGFALGLLLAYLRRQPLRWTLWILGSAVSGLAVGSAVAFPIGALTGFDPLLPACLTSVASVSIGAFILRDRTAWARAPYFRYALACGALLAVVSGFASYGITDRYVSTAVLQAVPPDRARLDQLQQEVLSRSSLAALIQHPRLDLYRRQRQSEPIEDIVQTMRNRDIRIRSVGGDLPAFTVQFLYPDRFKSQAVVRELVARFIQTNLSRPGSFVLEVLDPASLPAAPVFPNRLTITALGLAAGILLGFLIACFRPRPPNPGARPLVPDPSAA
jgi:capsular polysaccharide biosynthesis protein